MRVLRSAKALAVLAVAVGPFAIPAAAHAQVTRLEIQSRQPAAGGQVFGTAGPYEILRGRVHGEVDPRDPRNAIIQDLQLAPRNARGRVEYIATFALAKPIDLTKASGTLIYTVVNRGNGIGDAGPGGPHLARERLAR